MSSSPQKAQRSVFFISLIFWLTLFPLDSMGAEAQNARALVENSFNYMRGKTSVATVEMTIHRPDWQRTMTIKCWTKGQENSIFRIIAPAKDRGNGLLFNPMDIFNPFSPSDIEREYKTGDDMVSTQFPMKKTGNFQLLYVPRREQVSGDVKWNQSSLAGSCILLGA